jgi:hypothetical protein
MQNNAAKSAFGLTTEIGRRAVLVGTAAMLAAPAAARPALSPLDELIADYRLADAEREALAAEADRLVETVDLPKVEVRYGRRQMRDPETGETRMGEWIFASAYEVNRHFDMICNSWHAQRWPHLVPEIEAKRSAVMAELRAQEENRSEAERRAGVTAAELLADEALRRMLEIRREIFAYQPTSLGEVATKNAFLLEQVRDGINLQDDLTVIFGGACEG